MRLLLTLCLVALPAWPAAAQQTHLVVIGGLGGDPAYSDTFHNWAVELVDAAVDRHGLSPENVVFLGEQPQRDPARIDERSSRENIERILVDLAGRAAPGDVVFVVVIGHGSSIGDEARINLPGPDMGPSDFAPLLDRFTGQSVVFVNTASASGAFLAPLSAANRTIVTATKTSRERNETVFGGFFIEALAGEGADTDKDGRVSVLEAFHFARQEVAREYEADNRMLTEHAILDDNGDGEGSEEPDGRKTDGVLARSLFLDSGSPVAAIAAGSQAGDSVLGRLYREKGQLEGRIQQLRGQKESLDPELYERELEALLVDLALKSQEIRRREGGQP
jgi:hypothetical protein